MISEQEKRLWRGVKDSESLRRIKSGLLIPPDIALLQQHKTWDACSPERHKEHVQAALTVALALLCHTRRQGVAIPWKTDCDILAWLTLYKASGVDMVQMTVSHRKSWVNDLGAVSQWPHYVDCATRLVTALLLCSEVSVSSSLHTEPHRWLFWVGVPRSKAKSVH